MKMFVFLYLFSLLYAPVSRAETVLPIASTHQTMGTVNCAGSTCHGAITPWENSTILHNEYTTWLRLDKHAKAYNVLLNATSQRIVKNLGLKQPAHQTKLCLDCHTHNPSQDLRGERYNVSEGVGCEACHGPAEKWIASHTNTVNGITHADNLKNGMYPTENPLAQAKLCLSCHFGDENRFVSHRLMGAGHPRLSFEIDTFTALQPAHYKHNASWIKRKGNYDALKMWAIGQALAAQQLLDTLTDPKRGFDGLFPELVLFDCHACHHPMSEHKFSARLGIGPGRVHLNDSNFLMLRAIIAVVDPANASAFNAQVTQLHHAIAGSNNMKADPIALAKKLSTTIGDYITRLESKHFDVGILREILKALMDETSAHNYTDYAGAEQAYMAIESLTASLNRQGGLKNVSEVNRSLKSMQKVLANEDKYNPEAFKSILTSLRLAILSQSKNGNRVGNL